MKKIFLTFLASILLAATPAATMEVGTVINPLNYSGQFTVTAISSKTPSAAPILMQEAGNVIKEHGTPVIISFACSKLPWWAITTATGYVLIKQCNESTALLYNTLLRGSGYALGEMGAQEITANSLSYKAQLLQALALVGCVGIGYACDYTALQTMALAALQAIGFIACSDYASATLYPEKQQSSEPLKTLTPEERLQKILNENQLDGYNLIVKPYLIAAGIVVGGTAAATYVTIGALFAYLRNVSLPASILIHEQAYRTTKKGYAFLKKQFYTPSITASNQPIHEQHKK